MKVLSTVVLLLSAAGASAQAPAQPASARRQAPISATFTETSLRGVLDSLAERTGVKLLYDNDFRDKKVSLAFRDESFETALKQIRLTHRLFVKELSPKTMVVVPDTPDKHRKYDAWVEPKPLPIVSKREAIHLSFTEASLRKVFDALGEAAGIAVIYDADFRDKKVNVRFDGESFESALDQLALVNSLFYKPVGAHSLVIAPDTAATRHRYEEGDTPSSGLD